MSPSDPVCPVCSRAVVAGGPVIFDHGSVMHLNCFVPAEGVAPAVDNFLKSRPDDRFCFTCLAQAVRLDRQQVEKASVALRITSRILAEPGECSVCIRARVTVRFRPASGQPA
jgi:hypothetical protein